MKTRKKLLIALLSATCLTAGAFGFAACDKKTDTNDKALVGIYNAYKEEAEANNQTVLTYEEWLKAKLETVAQPGEQGDPGSDGKSAYEIAKENGFTGTEQEWLASLVGAAGAPGSTGDQGDPGANGVGVKSVAMSADGKSLIVTLTNDQTVTVALPKNITHSHSYAGEYHELIAAEDGKEGLAYQVCKANGCDHIELFAFNAPASGEGTASDPYVLNADLSKVGSSQSFKLKPTSGAVYGHSLNVNRDVYATFSVEKTGKYTLKDTAGVGFTLVEGGTVDADGAMCLYGGQDVTVAVNTDDTVYPEIIVSLTFEETLTAGKSQGFPLTLGADEVTLTSANADKDGYIYLKMTGAKGDYKFTSDDADIEVVLTRYEYSYESWAFEAVEETLTLNEVVSEVGVSEWPSASDAVLLKVKLSEGTKSATFKATQYFEAGEDISTAINLSFNTEVAPHETLPQVWYKYVVTTAALNTYECANDYGSCVIYDADGKRLEIASGTYPYYFATGTYYLHVEAGEYSFKLRAYNEETDVGLSKYATVTLNKGTASKEGDRYLKFTAAEAGKYVIYGDYNTVGKTYYYSVYNDNGFTDKVTLTDGEIELTEGQTIFIDTASKSLSVTVKLLSEVADTEVDYVFNVTDKDREGLKDITVKVNGKTATTDIEGKATISLVPGVYEVELEFDDDAKYSYTSKVTTVKLYQSNEVSVIVNVEKTYTITVKGSGEVKSGVEVSIWKVVTGDRGEETETTYEKVGETKTTNDEGKVTFVLLNDASYEVRLDKVPEGFSYSKKTTISSNQDVTINLTTNKPVDPENPDDPDEPAEKYTYLYKGWEQFVDGEQTFYLETSNTECAYELKVEGGYIKYLKTIVDEGWAVFEDEWIVDGVYTDYAEEWWYGTAGEVATEFIAGQYDPTFLGAQIELVICSYDGMETKVVFNKIPSNSDY